jgi:hypothetical protein
MYCTGNDGVVMTLPGHRPEGHLVDKLIVPVQYSFFLWCHPIFIEIISLHPLRYSVKSQLQANVESATYL